MTDYVRPTFAETASSPRASDPDLGVDPSYADPESYRPVAAVAQALVEYVAREYDVVVDAPLEVPAAHARWLPEPLSRIVRISPRHPGEVTVWIMVGTEPGVVGVAAGTVSSFAFPFCSCDRCDEPWQHVADGLEEVVLALARDGVRETVEAGRRGQVEWSLSRSRHAWSGRTPTRGVRRAELRRWADALAGLPDGRWAGWTPRRHDDG